MKLKLPLTTHLSVLTLAAVLAGCASHDSKPIIATRERFLELPIEAQFLFDSRDVWTLYVNRGDSRDAVLTACGRPEMVINANLWVYRNSYSSSEAARKGGCDTLLIAFTADRVTELKLVNREVLRSELAKQPSRVSSGG
jgi:hypothetical protein